MQVRMAYDVFMMSGVVQELELAESDLSLFLSAVAGHYHAHVPYHNFGHAVQVLHTVWMVSWRSVHPACACALVCTSAGAALNVCCWLACELLQLCHLSCKPPALSHAET